MRQLDQFEGAGGSESGDVAPFGHYAPTAAQWALIGVANATFLGRGTTRWWISSLLEKLRPGPIDIERLGLKLRLHHYGEHYSEKKLLLHAHHYDKQELAHILRAGGPRFQFVDIGAHAGFYSFTVKSQYPDALIAAFEPNTMYRRRMEFNIRANKLRDFHVIPAAAGAERSRGRLYLTFGTMSGDGPSEEVDVVPLYETLVEIGYSRIDALKIDVEGFEDRVLFPFFDKAPVAMRPRTIVIEHTFPDKWQRDCLELLMSLGYRLTWRGMLNSVYERHD